jgi:hypothetical protein
MRLFILSAWKTEKGEVRINGWVLLSCSTGKHDLIRL